MFRSARVILPAIFCSLFILAGIAIPCTNLIVTKGASTDGSVMITYTCDGVFHPHMEYVAAADHKPGDSVAITTWGGEVRGYIKQVPHTYAVVEFINEHQLAISETTFDGRLDLRNKEGLLGYYDLIYLALKRAKTARQAITVMTDLVAEYGYNSTGESFSIADTEEAWIMEMIGPGPGKLGAHWVAVKVPDGYISAHANKARIGTFPLDDPENCIYSEDVIDFAIEQGFYNPETDGDFRYNEAYCPSTPKNQRYGAARVWSLLRRAAPSQNFSPDYHRGVPGAEPYPLWIKPDEKISVGDVFTLMRDHYEGTPYSMRTGIDAGPYHTPNRWRPMHWHIGEDTTVTYAWERPISTQQTGFSFVSQSRGWMPDPIGGVLWYGLDDTWMTCYTPMYCGIDALPESFMTGSISKFSWESAWWVFNFVANFANLKYDFMEPDILKVRDAIEQNHLALQPAVEKVALELYKTDRDLLRQYLNDYCVSHAEMMVDRYRELGHYLITKYNDGYVRNEKGRAEGVGYPSDWLQRVVESRGSDFRLPEKDSDTPETRLID